MPTNKPEVEPAAAAAFLASRFDGGVVDFHPLEGGELSRAFSFAAGGDAYVLRYRFSGDGFERDRYAAETFASPGLPIPRVQEIGRSGDLHVAISERAAGTTLDKLPLAKVLALLPALAAVLDQIGRVDVAARSGFGVLDDHANGRLPGWPEVLLAVGDEEEGGFFGAWHGLFRDSFLDRDVFDRVHREMAALLRYCPEERRLVHGDFSLDNLLADRGTVTGVIDWSNAMYGDPLYDVAYLDFWTPEIGVARVSLDHAAERGGNVRHPMERLRCYRCHVALNALRFFAKSDRREAYTWTLGRLMALLDGTARLKPAPAAAGPHQHP